MTGFPDRIDAARQHFFTAPLTALEVRKFSTLFSGARVYGAMLTLLLLLGAYVASPYVERWMLLIFLGLLVAEVIIKISGATNYQRMIAKGGSPTATWRGFVYGGAVYSGIVYGISSLVVFLPMPIDDRITLIAVYAAILAWSVWGMADVYICGFLLSVPLCGLMALGIFVNHDDGTQWLGLPLLLVTGVGLWLNKQTGIGLIRLLELDLENKQLLDSLSREKLTADAERQRAEQAVIDKSRFIATASHDLRQPVHALGLYQHALELRCKDPDSLHIVEAIGESSSALVDLLDGLLDVSSLDARAVSPTIEPLDIKSLIDSIAREFRPSAEARGLSLGVRTTDTEAQCDRILLTRILRNLMSNAIKFSSSGKVELTARTKKDENGNPIVCVSVSDEGPGIPADDVNDVFVEFYRSSSPETDLPEGTGLGLSIVARLCAILGIQLQMDSRSGSGTTIHLGIPVSHRECISGASTDLSTTYMNRFDGLRVLVIDDEPSIRAGMREILESRGCRVESASGLSDAMTSLTANTPDVLLCDFLIEPKNNGCQIIDKLRRQSGQTIPAAIVSGEKVDVSLNCKNLTVLRKPVVPNVLFETIERLTDSGDNLVVDVERIETV